MAINIGDVVYMDYGFGEVHTRVVLAPVDPTSFEWGDLNTRPRHLHWDSAQ